MGETKGTGDFSQNLSISQDHSIFENSHAEKRRRAASPASPKWLTTQEAAEYLRVSISSIKTMIYRGQVRVHKLGRRNRFLIEELERLITLPLSHT